MIYEDECIKAGLDPKEIERIAKGLSRYARQAEALGMTIFGGSGSGSLRADDAPLGALVLADLNGNFDGGDGSCREGDDGLLRGETA